MARPTGTIDLPFATRLRIRRLAFRRRTLLLCLTLRRPVEAGLREKTSSSGITLDPGQERSLRTV